MSSQRYFPPERYMPPDSRQGPRQSSPRYANDRINQSSYGPGSQPRGTDHQRRCDDPRDRGFAPRGMPPRGPRAAAFDAPQGRMTDPAPHARGRPYGLRGDVRASGQWGGYREGPRAPEEPSSAHSWEQRDGNGREARDFGARRDSMTRTPLPRHFPEIREYGSSQRAAYETSRSRDSQDFAYEVASQRGRGRGRFRNDTAPRGRTRAESHGEDTHRFHTSGHSPGRERRWEQDGPRVPSSGDLRDDAPFPPRQREPVSRVEQPAQVFDPFTQDRAAARDSIPVAKPSPPICPVSRTQGEHPHHDWTPERGWRPPLPSVDRQNYDGQPSKRQFLRDSSNVGHSLEGPHAPAHASTRAPEASSPPQPPPVPAFGSILPAQIPQGPKSSLQDSRTSKAPPTAPTAPRGARLPECNQTLLTTELDREPPKAPKAARMQATASAPEQPPIDSLFNRRQSLCASQVSPDPPKSSIAQPPSNAPKGPTAGAPSAPQQPPPVLPVPSGPRGAPATTKQQHHPAPVPTGPKANRLPGPPPPPPPPPQPTPSGRIPTGPASGPARKPHWQANNGSTAGVAVPAKRDMHGVQVLRGSPAAPYSTRSGQVQDHDDLKFKSDDRQLIPSSTSFRPVASPHLRSPPKSPAWGDEPPDFEVASKAKEQTRPSKRPYEDDEEAVDGNDDLMELDEADFENKEAQFHRDKAKLEEEKIDLSSRRLRGATPLDNLALLSQLAILVLPQPEEPPALSQGDDESEDRMQPSTPEQPVIDEVDMTDKYWRQTSVELDVITKDDVFSLPFLHRGHDVPLQEQPFYKANAMKLEEDKQNMLQHMTRTTFSRGDAVEDNVRRKFREIYERWRDSIETLDQIEPVENPDGDDAFEQISYPLLDAPPMQLSTGGRRGGAVNGFELERVLQESLQTANQEEDKRKRLQASARFDPSREVCPPALDNEGSATRPVFVDTRNKFSDDDTRVAYNLEPDLDDFTEEEHERMIAAFTQWSKRWGKLAKDVGSDRSYKECIKHYYSSKWRGDFKDQRDKRRQRSKPGRLRSSHILGGRPKANALISSLGESRMDLDEGSEFAMPSMAMTDSGRPRRAAAPSFGAKEAEELPVPSLVTGKKGARSALITDAAQERSAKKTRSVARERGQRRPRSQALPRDASLSPEKLDIPTSTPHSFASRNGHGSTPQLITQAMTEATHVREDPTSPEAFRDSLMPSAGPQQEDPIMRAGGQTRKSGMSSYWSVHEVDQFVALVRLLGSDWEEIANRLGTKTPQMVKNLFKRKTGGQNALPGLEEDLRRADALRNQPHRFDLGGLHDKSRDTSTKPYPALHKPVDGFQGLPLGYESQVSNQSQDSNPFHPSGSATSIDPVRQIWTLEDQDYRLARSLDRSGFTARQSTEGDAQPRMQRAMESIASSGVMGESMPQHSMAPRLQTFPPLSYTQPASFEDHHGHVNQTLDESQDQMMRDQECGPRLPPASTPARIERQYGQPLSGREAAFANKDLPSTYGLGQNSTAIAQPAKQERTLPPSVQREPRKQSNIASILNAEPDEPSSRAPPLGSRSPPYSRSSNFDPLRPASHTDRRGPDEHTRNDDRISTPASGEMRPPFPPRAFHPFTTGIDWASRLISGENRSRQLFEYPGRSSSADLHHQEAHISRTQTSTTAQEYGAARNTPPEPNTLIPLSRSVEYPQHGMHVERAPERRVYAPGHTNNTYQERRSVVHNTTEDHSGQGGHERAKAPATSGTRSADDFLLNGSGTYRGRSAQFDRHLSQRQPPPPVQYRHHEPPSDSAGNQSNPFMHPEPRVLSQRQVLIPEPYRPPSTPFGIQHPSEATKGSSMGFGRIGSAQQQPANTTRSQDNEQSMSRPPEGRLI